MPRWVYIAIGVLAVLLIVVVIAHYFSVSVH